MKIKQIIFIPILLISCGQIKIDRNQAVELDSLQKENMRITIINDSTQMRHVTKKYSFFWTPTWQQLDKIDTILVHSISEIKDRKLYQLKVDSLKNYYRQYVCYKDSVGDSIIYINALHEVMYIPTLPNERPLKQDWQHYLIYVHDGGDCFWHIWINFSKKEQFRFIINGDA